MTDVYKNIVKYIPISKEFLTYELMLKYSKLWKRNPAYVEVDIDLEYDYTDGAASFIGYEVRLLKRRTKREKKYLKLNIERQKRYVINGLKNYTNPDNIKQKEYELTVYKELLKRIR